MVKVGEKWPEVRVHSFVSGAGMYVPERVIDNSYFESYLDTSDAWIQERTGIKQRRWINDGVTTSELAEHASRAAISQAGLNPSDIDGIVFATVTPDFLFPSAACCLQKRLGIPGCMAFDVNAVCSGFLYALSTANGLIASGKHKHILVVGAEVFSNLLDKHDRSTCILFGDGAGAIVLSRADVSQENFGVTGSAREIRGLYGSVLGADGNYGDILCVPEVVLEGKSTKRYLKMEGKEVFKIAVRKLGEVNEQVLSQTGIMPQQVDYYVSHQANMRILVATARHLGVPEKKMLMNVDRFGNTSAASIPILLADAQNRGIIKPGDLIALSAFGGGVTWGAALIRW